MLTTFYSSRASSGCILLYCLENQIWFECRPISHDQCELSVHEEDKHKLARAFTLLDRNAMVGSREESIGHPVQYILVRASGTREDYRLELQSGISVLMYIGTQSALNVVQLAKFLRVPLKLDIHLHAGRREDITKWAKQELVGILEVK